MPGNLRKLDKKVIIIIPTTYNHDYLLKCLDHCSKLNYSNFSVIILPDQIFELPPHLNKQRFKIIPTGQITISAKRNIGIKNSLNSDYYAFIDSDAYPDKNWLKNGLLGFESSEIWAVGGPNISPPDEDLFKKAVGNASKSIFISGLNNYRKKISKNRICSDLPTCNLIVKKEFFSKYGLFNEQLITGEDIDLCFRITKAKRRILYKQNVIVYHYDRPLFIPFILQRITYGFSVFRLIRNNFKLSNIYFFFPSLLILFLLISFIFSFFSNFILLIFGIIISIYILLILIETLRYSDHIKEIPYTFLALIIGNLSPGISTILILFNYKEYNTQSVKKMYKNY